MQTSNEKIYRQIVQLINKIIFTEKKKIFKFKGITLYPSEVHLMLAIKSGNDTNATEIAREFGVTKGAISQTITRLEKKGIISKIKDPYNKNELTLSLTDFGKKAHSFWQKSQVAFVNAHEDYFSKLNLKEKEVVLNFLQHMEKSFDHLKIP